MPSSVALSIIPVQLGEVSDCEQHSREGHELKAASGADCSYPDQNSPALVSAGVRNIPVDTAACNRAELDSITGEAHSFICRKVRFKEIFSISGSSA